MERGEEGAQCRQINSPFLPFFLCWGRTKAKEGARKEGSSLLRASFFPTFWAQKNPLSLSTRVGFPFLVFASPSYFLFFSLAARGLIHDPLCYAARRVTVYSATLRVSERLVLAWAGGLGYMAWLQAEDSPALGAQK